MARSPGWSASFEFYRGFAAALASIARSGHGSLAVDAMKTNGVTLEDFKRADVDSFDLNPLSEAWELSA